MFEINFHVQPSMDRSYVQVEKNILYSSNSLKLRVYMFDTYGNSLKD